MRYDRAAVNLCSLGLYSNISWAGMGCAILVGGTVVVMAGFDAGEFLATVQRRRELMPGDDENPHGSGNKSQSGRWCHRRWPFAYP